MATTIFTDYGQQLITEAIANKTTINITKIAVGDGMGAVYTPVSSQTALKRETWSGPIDSVQVNPTNKNQVTFEGIVGANAGGFYIREIGLYDQANKLVAISDFPESFKALADQYELYVRMILQTGSADVTNIIVSKDMIYATKKYVDTETAKKYSKPTSGIPKTDLTAAVQTSLEKADNAAPTTELAKTNQALTTHQADLASQASGKGASLIGINDSGNLLTATTVEGALAEVMAKANSAFQSASDGKVLIANAITGKGQIASGSDTFVQLATAIGNIKVGKEKANGTITSASGQVYIPGTTGGAGNSYYVSFDMSVLGFVPSILIFTFASKTNTTVGSIWWKENYYVNGSYYANAQCNGAGFRVPYSSAVLQIPISNQNTAFDWVAYSI